MKKLIIEQIEKYTTRLNTLKTNLAKEYYNLPAEQVEGYETEIRLTAEFIQTLNGLKVEAVIGNC